MKRLIQRVRRAVLTAVTAGLALVGCEPVDLLNAVVPTEGLTRERGVAYGPNPRHRLDIYRPAAADGDLPVVVFIYGGSWQEGTRNDYLFVGETLAGQGFLVVIPDYRLYPEVTYPGFVEDGAKAVAWVHANIAAHGGDPSRMAIAGHSAGAYNAAMVALDPRWLADEGLSPEILSGFAGLAGPYDFLPIKDPAIKAIFHVVPDREETQPIRYASTDDPPVLLLHGGRDETVGPHNSANLAAALRRAGVSVTHKVYPRKDHIDIIVAISSPLRDGEPVLPDLATFLQRVLAKPALSPSGQSG